MKLKSISLYIHIPFCRQKCDYCDFYSVAECNRRGGVNDLSDDYIRAVLNEVKSYVSYYGIEFWETVYVGGGTPSLMTEAQLSTLIQGVRKSVPVENDEIEITVEMNPENVTESYVKTAREAGVNRISMGIQALDDEALSCVHRGCSAKKCLEALDVLDSFWNGRISVDFIAGLPGQTMESFRKQFSVVLSRKVDHVSLYTLTVAENTPLGIKIDQGEVEWKPEIADEMWFEGRKILEDAGYFQYEVSNFSKRGYESRHNKTYWNLNDYLGCGCGATGSVYEDKIRWTNTMSIPVYENFFLSQKNESDPVVFPREIEVLDKDVQIFEFLMMGLRLKEGVCRQVFVERFGEDFPEKFYEVFEEWKKKNWSEKITEDGRDMYRLCGEGYLFLNSFLEELI